MLAESVSSLKLTAELELALFDQKGLVSNYLLDGSDHWLELLEQKRRYFEGLMQSALDLALADQGQSEVQRIAQLYGEYDSFRRQIVELARQGDKKEAIRQQLTIVTGRVTEIHQACQLLLLVHQNRMAQSERENQRRLSRLQWGVWSSLAAALLLGSLAGFLINKSMTHWIVRAGKLAVLAETAGYVAHEVRNPLTAIKIRLHTLRQHLPGFPAGTEDVDVIAEEIERVERIVHDFWLS